MPVWGPRREGADGRRQGSWGLGRLAEGAGQFLAVAHLVSCALARLLALLGN